MNTSYGIGEVFAHAVEGGCTLSDAHEEEIAMIQYIYESPVEAQAKLMDPWGTVLSMSGSTWQDYKKKMTKTVMAAR